MELFIVTAAIIGALMLLMAVGVMFKRKPLRGSCGGAEIWDCDGDDLTCGACPNRAKKKQQPREAHPAELLRELTGSQRNR